eukprot:TRINITY_DN15982_c0_g1_i1.p2 TRINITY_DN15982_c0_g1~~TRINITY_DN15982_c0_g1_i1.p2  ORF type:complete len:491 (+),score=172.79 TRINITY_DN15982_c0_g1_i1:91-1563(+)
MYRHVPVHTSKRDTSDVWWRPEPEEVPKFFYPPAPRPVVRPMVRKTLCVEKQVPRPDGFATRDFARRLNKSFHRLEDLRNYICSQFDPNRSGFIGLGDFVCLWFKNHRLRHRRSYAQQLQVMGKEQPKRVLPVHTAAVAAVAAALASRTLQREQANMDSRRAAPPPRPWWGDLDDGGTGGACWRGDSGRRAVARGGGQQTASSDFTPRRDGDGDWVFVTPGLVLKLRGVFKGYDENDGSNPADASMHIRFGLVTHFLQRLRADPDLGPFFAMTHLEIGRFLNDLVRHTNDTMHSMRTAAAAKLDAVDTRGDGEDLEWDGAEDEQLARVLEEARRSVKERSAAEAVGDLRAALDGLARHQIAHRPPPYFEEPTFVFSCMLALLLKQMVPKDGQSDAPGQDELLGFFNQGVRYFFTLVGEEAGGGADVPRVLPVRVLLREFAHLEIAKPGATAFTDAHNPNFAGLRTGKFKMDLVPQRKIAAYGEIGTGGVL